MPVFRTVLRICTECPRKETCKDRAYQSEHENPYFANNCVKFRGIKKKIDEKISMMWAAFYKHGIENGSEI